MMLLKKITENTKVNLQKLKNVVHKEAQKLESHLVYTENEVEELAQTEELQWDSIGSRNDLYVKLWQTREKLKQVKYLKSVYGDTEQKTLFILADYLKINKEEMI
jgi:hypothetical protein